ncbi:MAG TPA: hypothetical protein VFS60_18475 [Thermoanaerobaculia bacterium]|nr:hypothetical protein [Thermoanaerobaculia bacterium]
MIRPTRRTGGWHRVQYNLEDVYCGQQPSKLFDSILTPGARLVTENHYAGALFTDLYVRGDAGPAKTWLRAQLDGEHQGGEQGGGYTNYYRADVLAALRWATEHGDRGLAESATTWLRRSYALDLLHTVPGGYEVNVPCSRNKLYNRDGREMSLRLLAGEADPLEVLGARRWQYPAYDDVRWLADALIAGRLKVDPQAAAWAKKRERAALEHVLAELRGVRLRSPLRWVLLDSGGWYSFAPNGMEAPYRPIDGVAVTANGEVSELARERGSERVPVREERGRLVFAAANVDGTMRLPPGRVVVSVDIGRGDAAAKPAR